MRGIGSEQTTMLWRTIHDLLPTNQRIHRIMQNTAPYCTLCLEQEVVEDRCHAFFHCSHNREAGQALINMLTSHMSDPFPENLLLLKYGEVEEVIELAITWLISMFLIQIWERRRDKRSCSLNLVLTEIRSHNAILMETSYSNTAHIIENFLNLIV